VVGGWLGRQASHTIKGTDLEAPYLIPHSPTLPPTPLLLVDSRALLARAHEAVVVISQAGLLLDKRILDFRNMAMSACREYPNMQSAALQQRWDGCA
jgi:hypothetical protein